MSPATSLHSTTGTIAGYARKLTHGRPDLNIVLDNHHDGQIYSTLDAIKGRVELTTPYNTRFDEIRITFEGTTKTYVERVTPSSTRARVSAVQNFLTLAMPIRDSVYPQPRMAEAGQTYKFEFNFVVPEQLLLRACAHKISNAHVRDAHLQVPPSLGDREISGSDDLAPDSAKIQYGVKVRVIKNLEKDGQEQVLVEGVKKLHVVSAVQEAPPLSLGGGYEDYVCTQTKCLKKRMFSGKLGRITVSAAQPGALVLPAPALSGNVPPTTMVTVKLRFDPHEAASRPPRLGALSTKIKSATFYSARPAQLLPTYTNMISQYETTRGLYNTSISLSSRCVESVAWKRQEPTQPAGRRNSDSSTSSSDISDATPIPGQKDSSSPFYTATILVPINLPQHKTWIPSFHSCIVSRVYAIDICLSVHTPGTGVPATSLALQLPVQIAADGNQTERAALTAAEAAAELADANLFLAPGVIEIPSEEFVGNSRVLRPAPAPASHAHAHSASELPPSYEDFVRQPAVVDPGKC